MPVSDMITGELGVELRMKERSPLIGSGLPCCGGGLFGLLPINYSLQILIFNYP